MNQLENHTRKQLIISYILLGFNIYTPLSYFSNSKSSNERNYIFVEQTFLLNPILFHFLTINHVRAKSVVKTFYRVHKRVLLYVRRMIRLSGSLILFLRNERICFWMNKENNFYYNHLSKFLQQVFPELKKIPTIIMHFRKNG